VNHEKDRACRFQRMISASTRRKRHRSSSPTSSPSLPRRRPTRRCISLAPNYIEVSNSSSPSQQHQTQESVDSAASFEVRAILDQRANRNGEVVEYLVDWQNSPRTGRAYSPSWEPIGNIDAPAKVAEFNNNLSLQSAREGHGTLDEDVETGELSNKAASNNSRIQRRRRLIESDIDISESPLVIQENNHQDIDHSPELSPYPVANRTLSSVPSRYEPEGFSRSRVTLLVPLLRDQNIDTSLPFISISASSTSAAIASPLNRSSRLARNLSDGLIPVAPAKPPRDIIPESQPYQPNFSNPSPSTAFIASTNSNVSCYTCQEYFKYMTSNSSLYLEAHVNNRTPWIIPGHTLIHQAQNLIPILIRLSPLVQ
jgi:hypothetical protein